MDTISLANATRKRLAAEKSGAAHTASVIAPVVNMPKQETPSFNVGNISLATAAKKRLEATPKTPAKSTFMDNATAIAHDVYTAVSGIGDSFWGFADWVIKDD